MSARLAYLAACGLAGMVVGILGMMVTALLGVPMWLGLGATVIVAGLTAGPVTDRLKGRFLP